MIGVLLIQGADNKEECEMFMQTERGSIYVACEFPTDGEAIDMGYTYSFTSSQLRSDVYGKCLDDRGLRHEFAIVRW